MRRVWYPRWAAPVLVAFLLSGCRVLGKQKLKPAPPTLTHGRFVYLADHVCARDGRRSQRAFKNKPENHVQYDRKLNAVLKSRALELGLKSCARV